MKTKLLRKIRRRANNEIHITSITNRGGITIGMSYTHDEDYYSGLFDLGDSKDDVMRKVQHIYFEKHKSKYYKKYKNENSNRTYHRRT